ncbi:NAD(P)/FAD-dependent oxidoreductase [Lewinella cohaerens]|uniref:NAD(P)/FAD-dependent oxidoreductase n=1 Tax=Lewinella cohaerens TaxID=70995 RepID=UPI00035FFE65|nr:tryptophan 7-halogenase [Lewinella cohaerens]
MAVTTFKILIIGAGPAGTAAAIFASQQGWEVSLLDRRSDLFVAEQTQPRVGESLPPTIQPLLQNLAIWEDFQKAPHLPTYGIQSRWGSDKVVHRDYLVHPLGHGWHLDRQMFEQQLLRKAIDGGATFIEGAVLQEATLGVDKWQVTWQAANQQNAQKTFDFIIDASGRNAWLARRQGIDRLYEHQQLALIRFLKTPPDFSDSTGLIETTPNGWWYTAQIPGDRLSTAFFCRPGKETRQAWGTEAGWEALYANAPSTAARIAKTNGVLTSPRFVAADSSRLENFYGPGWVAIGDAALTLDPVSSHGITMALVTARDAIKAIKGNQDGLADAFASYDAVLTATFYQYAQQRRQLYQSERRFPDSIYW